MLVNLVVVLISDDGCFVFSNGLYEIILFFIEEANLDESVTLSLQSESVCKDRVLEITDGLLNLVCLREDHSKFVKHFTLLVKVWRHFENCNQSTNGMVV